MTTIYQSSNVAHVTYRQWEERMNFLAPMFVADPFQDSEHVPLCDIGAKLPQDTIVPQGWAVIEGGVEGTSSDEQCVTRDNRRETYARAIAAAASMPHTKQVANLLYIVESRTGNSATPRGLEQAADAADKLCAMAGM